MRTIKFFVNLLFAVLLFFPVSASALTLDVIVGTNDILNEAVTTPKIADSAVTTVKVADGAITAAKLAPGAVAPAGYAGMKVVHKGPADGVNTFNTVNAALNAITDASMFNRYLVKVMPGSYSETVAMKSYVDIAGSGQENTVIIGNPAIDWQVNNTILSDIQVIGDLGMEAITVWGGADAIARNILVTVTDYGSASAITTNPGAGSLELHNSRIKSNNGGFGIDGNFYGLLISNCIIEIHGSASYAHAAGILAWDNTVIVDTIIKVSSPLSGYYNTGIVVCGNTTIRNSDISANDVNGEGISTLCTSAPHAVQITNSTIFGSARAITGTSQVDQPFKVGNSQIKGGHNGAAGIDKVVNCFDENFVPISNL